MNIIDKFIDWDFQSGFLFYVWGHSFEYDRDNNWNMIENFCCKVSDNDDIWYATNIEIFDYVMTQKSLIVSANGKIIKNPTALTLWFSKDEDVIKINPGETLYL